MPLTVSFDGSASTGSNLTYAWSFGNGQSGTGQKVTHTYQTAGKFSAILTIASGQSQSRDTVVITVVDPSRDPVLISLGRAAVASSEENSQFAGHLPASNAVDGSTTTRWSSEAGSEDEWIYVDLGGTKSFGRVILRWEAAYASQYKVQVSSDASSWTDMSSTTTGNGGIDTINANASGRYVRMLGIRRGTEYGYSLYEFEIYQVPRTTVVGRMLKPRLSALLASTGGAGPPEVWTVNGQRIAVSRVFSRYGASAGIYLIRDSGPNNTAIRRRVVR